MRPVDGQGADRQEVYALKKTSFMMTEDEDLQTLMQNIFEHGTTTHASSRRLQVRGFLRTTYLIDAFWGLVTEKLFESV
jgi:hypothetical protein